MDEGSAQAVRVAFKRLYDDGLAYRGEQLINWCPGCLTSVSDLEVDRHAEKGTLWTVRYHLLDAAGTPDPIRTITVATTRPETILGDTAVAVHPDDARYRALVGRNVPHPVRRSRRPVIADDVVEREFGTGAVKITPAHDLDDFETGKRHGLPLIDVMTDDGRDQRRRRAIRRPRPLRGADSDPGRPRGTGRPRGLEAARDGPRALRAQRRRHRATPQDAVVHPRQADGGQGARLGARGPDAHPANPLREGLLRLDGEHPRLERQPPAVVGPSHPGLVLPGRPHHGLRPPDGPPACVVCGRPSAELRQEEDIFDTWFSSGLWPFSTLGWPERTPDLERYYPGTVMETGYEILFFWVARMMMLGEWLLGEPPFATVYLHGIVRDPYGAKMSKTKGNVVDPLAVIDEMGADALRFALVHGPAPGADVRMSRAKLEGARNFANKLWNAARFVLGARPAEVQRVGAADAPGCRRSGAGRALDPRPLRGDRRSRLRAHDAYQMGEVTRLLQEAIWSEYCDWYLELAKASLGDPAATPAARAAIWRTLAWVLERYLRLLHPVMPHITEEIWARLPHEPGDPDLLIVADWPAAERERALSDAASGAAVEALIDLVRAIRNARAEAGIEAGSVLEADLVLRDPTVRGVYSDLVTSFERLSRSRPVRVHATSDGLPPAGQATLVVIAPAGEARLSRGSGDLSRERARLDRELAETGRQLAAAESRLADPAFTTRAPASVVDGARHRRDALAEQAATLAARLAAISADTSEP